MTPLKGLKARRTERGDSIYAMGKLLGTTGSHYRKFETGEVRLDLHRAMVLAKHLGCALEDLL